ncbi:MAG TPA: antibiotic biosynthesis monooxygenase [Thermoanaerobaculia bacterium]|nr:antibiotic biosynthesis monooxygenase [Thermoanaerobaculia bacterium]
MTATIVRLWHGRVPTAKAPAYRRLLDERLANQHSSPSGRLSGHILERVDGEVTHFVVMTFWDSLAAVRTFLANHGEPPASCLDDRDFLLDLEPRVVQYEVARSP